jgi:DNA polymerase sigma
LDPHEEEKLSGDMRELYDRLLPTPESEQRRITFVEKLERILRGEWPGHEFKVHVFGSSGNLLCTSESDGIVPTLRTLDDNAKLFQWTSASKRR